MKLSALQQMAAQDTLRDEFDEALWTYAQDLETEDIKAAFLEALKNFRQEEVKE